MQKLTVDIPTPIIARLASLIETIDEDLKNLYFTNVPDISELDFRDEIPANKFSCFVKYILQRTNSGELFDLLKDYRSAGYIVQQDLIGPVLDENFYEIFSDDLILFEFMYKDTKLSVVCINPIELSENDEITPVYTIVIREKEYSKEG